MILVLLSTTKMLTERHVIILKHEK